MPSYPEGKDWFDYESGANYLHNRLPGGYSERSLRAAKAAGDIEVIKLRGKVWIRKENLDTLIARLTSTPAT